MRIAGIYPEKIGDIDVKIQHAVSEPYGLEMILAVAKRDGHEVELFVPFERKAGAENKAGLSEREYIEKICSFNPDVAAFSLYTCQYPAGVRIARELKRRIPKITTIAGNRYPTYLKHSEHPFDFFCLKEGEETFSEFLKVLADGKRFRDVKGLSFIRNGKRVFTGIRPRNFNLDSLPDALRFPVITDQVYRGVSIPPLSASPHFAVVEYSRCCYNNCKFCDNGGFWGNKVVFRSPERVVDEMFRVQEKGADIFYFMDLNFTANPEKTSALCDEMIKRNLNASWYCMSNTATAEKSDELLHMMKKAGCFKIAWGVESTSDAALERMNKKVGQEFTTSEQTSRVLQKSLEAGMINQGFYIIGFPWETPKSIMRDSEGLSRIPMHILNIGIFTPIPLSRFHTEMISEGYAFNQNLQNHDRNTLVFNHRKLVKPTGDYLRDMHKGNEVIKVLQQQIYDKFYSSPEYAGRLQQTCAIDRRFKPAFNDYFRFIGKEIRV